MPGVGRGRIDEFFRPEVLEIYDSPSLTYVPPIPVPHVDLKIIHPPKGCRVNEIDLLNPEFTDCTRKMQTFHDLSDKLSVAHRKRIKEWAAMCGYYGLPGFEKPKSYLDHIFSKPTKSSIKFKNSRKFDTASQPIVDAPAEFKSPSMKEYLLAVDAARTRVRVARLRAEGKNEEADALEAGKYDVYVPEGPIRPPEEVKPPRIKGNVVSRLPDYAHEPGRRLVSDK